ncbi:MAG: hypothetical protein HZB51_25505 [Chloroflexi bacterium]|nr:hypothetical protein [Chloroflexota bacterium]
MLRNLPVNAIGWKPTAVGLNQTCAAGFPLTNRPIPSDGVADQPTAIG